MITTSFGGSHLGFLIEKKTKKRGSNKENAHHATIPSNISCSHIVLFSQKSMKQMELDLTDMLLGWSTTFFVIFDSSRI
jgi:hypothetical protein